MVKNILEKDFTKFMDGTFSFENKFYPTIYNSLPALKNQLWRHIRTKLAPVYNSRKIKMMYFLLDKSGKELAECLERGC
jgi:hypothetical protein